ncbi:MAG TPA: hypothetical protein VLH77_02195, partial [Gammaproteobacteria bacterium]|nr:hypothetical protein [Gammaproteobacteria bacterium]
MQSSAPHLQEEKLTGIAAQELQALSQSLTVLVAEMTKRHLLGDELQQTVIGAALQIVQRIIVFYGKYITKTNLTAADAGQLASLALKSSNGMFLQGLGSLMSGVSKTVMSVTAQDGSIVDEFKGLFTAIATDKKIEQILNKVLQTIFQAVAWRSTGRWRSTVRWRSVVLSGGVILKFDINLNDKNEKEELEQEAEIFSAPIIIINNHKLMIYGKKSHLKWQMYTFTQAELGAEWHHPEFSVKKNRRIVYSKIDPLLMKTLRRCHTYFDEVYDTLHSFVDGVKSGAFPAITLPPDEKSLQDAYTMTSWPQVISKFFPSLDAKPFEDAFHLLMKKITGSKKEENEQVQVFKDVLGEILQPLSPLKKSLYYWSKSLIKSGYNLELMPDKIRDFPVLAEDGKVYISDDGTYYVRDSQSVLRKGSLSNSGIDLRNLSLQLLMDMDKVLKKRILKVIKNEGHITLKNELLPASALEVIKDLLRLYASLETAILSKDHAFILK